MNEGAPRLRADAARTAKLLERFPYLLTPREQEVVGARLTQSRSETAGQLNIGETRVSRIQRNALKKLWKADHTRRSDPLVSPPERLFAHDEVREQLGISGSNLFVWTNKAGVEPVRRGKNKFYTQEMIDKIAQVKAEPPPPKKLPQESSRFPMPTDDLASLFQKYGKALTNTQRAVLEQTLINGVMVRDAILVLGYPNTTYVYNLEKRAIRQLMKLDHADHEMKENCKHHWVISLTPNSLHETGVCKHCQSERTFPKEATFSVWK